MADEVHIEPISAVEVASLHVTCSMCGHANTIEYDALDVEAGKVDPFCDFDICEECGHGMDCQAATFSARILKDALTTKAPG